MGGSGNGVQGLRNDWPSAILVFGFWVGLMYYVITIAPNQTPSRDLYFLQKLFFLKQDDFQMNQVFQGLWGLMGLWPLIYTMLLIPSGRSSNRIPVWPFLIITILGGGYTLIPYFFLWKPPPPPVSEEETKRWPLKFFELKIIPTVMLIAGLGLITYAGFANADEWKGFFQLFGESNLVHITTIDFFILSAFAPFWVYNDMAVRKWLDKGSWLVPVALIPFLGPLLYIVLRPRLSVVPTATKSD